MSLLAVATTRLGTEVSAHRVPRPQEHAWTRPVRTEEVTHCDKGTLGTGLRSEPRPSRGSGARQKPLFPAPPLSPSLPPLGTVTYLAGTECSQGTRDPGRSRTRCPVPLLGAPFGTADLGGPWTWCQLGKRGVPPTAPTAARTAGCRRAGASGGDPRGAALGEGAVHHPPRGWGTPTQSTPRDRAEPVGAC